MVREYRNILDVLLPFFLANIHEVLRTKYVILEDSPFFSVMMSGRFLNLT